MRELGSTLSIGFMLLAVPFMGTAGWRALDSLADARAQTEIERASGRFAADLERALRSAVHGSEPTLRTASEWWSLEPRVQIEAAARDLWPTGVPRAVMIEALRDGRDAEALDALAPWLGPHVEPASRFSAWTWVARIAERQSDAQRRKVALERARSSLDLLRAQEEPPSVPSLRSMECTLQILETAKEPGTSAESSRAAALERWWSEIWQHTTTWSELQRFSAAMEFEGASDDSRQTGYRQVSERLRRPDALLALWAPRSARLRPQARTASIFSPMRSR